MSDEAHDVGGLGAAVHQRFAGASVIGPGGAPGVGHRLERRGRGALVVRGAAAALAVGAATAGALLLLSPAQVALTVTAAEYHVGGASLARVAPDGYSGQGALQLTTQADGTVLAAGDASVGGTHITGQCLEDADHRAERCVFDVGGAGLGALDTWSGHGWHRRYDDGRVIEVTSSTAAPVPFLVGR